MIDWFLYIFSSIGLVVVGAILYVFIRYAAYPKALELFDKRNQIFCKHKYMETYFWENDDYIAYDVACKKCNRKKHIVIYKQEKENESRND